MTSGGLFMLAWFLAAAFVFGLMIGSFLNVVIHRLPHGESIVSPPSHCPGCRTPIAPWDNIPLLSFAILGGQCRHCDARIAWRYPAVELLTGCVFVALAYRFGITPWTPIWMLFSAALIAAAMIDIDHQIIPDEISLGGLLAGLAIVPFALVQVGASPFDAIRHAALGALVGSGSLWLVGFAHARISVASGRHFEHWPGEGEEVPEPRSLDYWTWFPGLGFGDVKLLAMIGAFLGPFGVLLSIALASLAGLAIGLGWALATRSFTSPFGFAPAIAAGALIALFTPDYF
jgi:leader peptidase (prepilin peptidase)/N-methyltransferase